MLAKKIYSNSKLGAYESCPWQYKLHYIDGLEKPGVEGIEAFVGSRVHDVLEKCYKDLKFAKVNSLEELLAFYNKIWDENWNDTIFITRKEYTKEDYKNSGEKCIKDYYSRYAPFDQASTIATESLVMFPLDKDSNYLCRGYVDRIDISRSNTYEIHDYKTSRYLPTQKNADEDRQLGFYQIAVQDKWKDATKVKLVWHYLIFDKEITSSRTAEALKSLKISTIRLIDEIESKYKELEKYKGDIYAGSEIFVPNESNLCDWCEFPEYCPKRRHLHDVGQLTVNKYLKEPGVRLVNKLNELQTNKKEIETKVIEAENEIEKVKEALIDYADKKKLDAIKGSGCMAVVSRKDIIKFPTKGNEERDEIEELIKKEGKWIEVSDLNLSSLKKVVESKSWDKNIIKKIMKFAKLERKIDVRLRKLEEEE